MLIPDGLAHAVAVAVAMEVDDIVRSPAALSAEPAVTETVACEPALMRPASAPLAPRPRSAEVFKVDRAVMEMLPPRIVAPVTVICACPERC